MAHNYPKWPKNDARIDALFPQILLTKKAVPQTFSLLESMQLTCFLTDLGVFFAPCWPSSLWKFNSLKFFQPQLSPFLAVNLTAKQARLTLSSIEFYRPNNNFRPLSRVIGLLVPAATYDVRTPLCWTTSHKQCVSILLQNGLLAGGPYYGRKSILGP